MRGGGEGGEGGESAVDSRSKASSWINHSVSSPLIRGKRDGCPHGSKMKKKRREKEKGPSIWP